MVQTIPNTLLLIGLALIPVTLGSLPGAFQSLQKCGIPFIFSVFCQSLRWLFGSSSCGIDFAGASEEGLGYWSRMIAAALTLGIADGALSGSILGNRSIFAQENQQRYVGISILRGESNFSNTLPNLAGAIVGQDRTRVVQLLSAAVIVEVIVQVDGFGALLFKGTLKQDFGVVLAAATIFAVISSSLLMLQAIVEVIQNLHMRRAPMIDLSEVGGDA